MRHFVSLVSRCKTLCGASSVSKYSSLEYRCSLVCYTPCLPSKLHHSCFMSDITVPASIAMGIVCIDLPYVCFLDGWLLSEDCESCIITENQAIRVRYTLVVF